MIQAAVAAAMLFAFASASTAQDAPPLKQFKSHVALSMFECKAEQMVARIQQRTYATAGVEKVIGCTTKARSEGQALAKAAMESMKSKDGKDGVVAAYGAYSAALDGIPSVGEHPAAWELRMRQLEARLNDSIARLDLLD